MNFFRKFLFSIMLLSSAAHAQEGTTVNFEGNFVSTASATGTGLKLYYGSRPTVTVDLVTNDLYWQFAEGKDVMVAGVWGRSESDGEFRLIAKDVQPMAFRKGKMESAFGVGGESTGFQLSMANGLKIEIDLQTYGLTREFALDRAVEVRGYFKVIQAVETRRVVLVVNQVKPVL